MPSTNAQVSTLGASAIDAASAADA